MIDLICRSIAALQDMLYPPKYKDNSVWAIENGVCIPHRILCVWEQQGKSDPQDNNKRTVRNFDERNASAKWKSAKQVLAQAVVLTMMHFGGRGPLYYT